MRLHLRLAFVLACGTAVTAAFALTPQQATRHLAPTPLQPAPAKASGHRAPAMPAPALAAQAITSPGAILPLAAIYVLNPGGQPGPRITFPTNVATAQAVRRIASRSVSAMYNRCATTVAEAMGFQLGDAHDWVKLMDCGYGQRSAAEGARPGDIVVWPFTYGRNGSEHVGICVGTENGCRLLSNMSGCIGLTELIPGYRAYYKTVAPLLTPATPDRGLARQAAPAGTDG